MPRVLGTPTVNTERSGEKRKASHKAAARVQETSCLPPGQYTSRRLRTRPEQNDRQGAAPTTHHGDVAHGRKMASHGNCSTPRYGRYKPKSAERAATLGIVRTLTYGIRCQKREEQKKQVVGRQAPLAAYRVIRREKCQ